MKLNGIEIPRPQNFNIEPTEIAKVDRMASGRMVKDVVAIKNKYSLSYDGLLPADAKTFINIYQAGNAVSFEYEDSEGLHTVLVYLTSLPREIFIYKPEYTQNISIVLEEE